MLKQGFVGELLLDRKARTVGMAPGAHGQVGQSLADARRSIKTHLGPTGVFVVAAIRQASWRVGQRVGADAPTVTKALPSRSVLASDFAPIFGHDATEIVRVVGFQPVKCVARFVFGALGIVGLDLVYATDRA
jgi:hypothetical protein